MERLGSWWNGTWAKMSRRNITLSRLTDGRYYVEWTDRDGSQACWRVHLKDAHDVVVSLIEQDGGDGWRETTDIRPDVSELASPPAGTAARTPPDPPPSG